MFGIRNGMTQQAYCSVCTRSWEQCLRGCNRQAQPVNRNGRPLRLLNSQSRSAAWRYRGQPMAVFCNGCGGPYYNGCCNGFYSPINALGEVLMLDGLMGGFMGTPDILAAAMVSDLMGCGLCYGVCMCTANSASLIGDIMLIDGIVDGNVAEATMGAMLSCGNCYGSCSCGMGMLMAGFVAAEVADEIGDAREDREEQQAYQDGYADGQQDDQSDNDQALPDNSGYADQSSDTTDYSQPDQGSYDTQPYDSAPAYDPPADTGGYDSGSSDFGGGYDSGGGW
jgi:hypothetical protein